MFWCGQESKNKKGQGAVEVYDKVAPEDKKQFLLNSVKGIPSIQLIERMANHRPVACLQLKSGKVDYEKINEDSNLSDYVKRKIIKSDYDQLVEKYSKSNELWKDPDFLPNQESWGGSRKNVVWKRASQILKNPKFVDSNFTPADILQGKLGNCYFLSAVAGLAEKPYRIKKLFPSFQINKNGIYMARILHRGVYQQVVVDDYFPCLPSGELLGAQPAGGNEIWVMVLEKCWAKMFGSYDAIDGGLPHEVLHAFSAAPTYNYRLRPQKDELEKLWNNILKADMQEQIICCGTEPQSRTNHLTELGLVGGHAYTILGAYDQPYRILKIRNPWGNMEWKGRANDHDNEFWNRISVEDQLRMGFNTDEDGTFFMLWDDFERFFIVVDICRINDNAHYYYLEDAFEQGNPICYDIKVEGGGDLTLTASQTSKRELKKINKGQTNFKLANATLIIGRTNDQLNEFTYVNSKADYSYSDLYMSLEGLPKGRYILCCFVEGDKPKTDSTISVYSESNIALDLVKINYVDFLHNIYLDHARKNKQAKQTLCPAPEEWACFELLADNCGFGYSAFHLDPKSIRKLGLQFDESEYTYNGLELLTPFKNAGNFKLVCEKGQETIVLCRLKAGSYATQFTMPTPKMYRLR